jgi:hypothetical protein
MCKWEEVEWIKVVRVKVLWWVVVRRIPNRTGIVWWAEHTNSCDIYHKEKRNSSRHTAGLFDGLQLLCCRSRCNARPVGLHVTAPYEGRGAYWSHTKRISNFPFNVFKVIPWAVPWLRSLVAGLSPRRPGFAPMWDLWWTKWHWDSFSPSSSVFLCQYIIPLSLSKLISSGECVIW